MKLYLINRFNRQNIQDTILSIVGVFLTGIFISSLFFSSPALNFNAAELEIEEEQPINILISCVGDVMVHKPQIDAQYDVSTGTYDFNNNFKYIKSYIENADLALANVETTFNGAPHSGYPLFNAPDQLAEALKIAGFDVAITANNHMMDKGFSGMERTIEVLRNAGLTTTGSKHTDEADYSISEVKGVKIATMAYTYETPNVNGSTTINGNYVSEQALPLINTFNYNTVDEDFIKLANSITSAREEGAEIIIGYFHWGEEYQRTPNSHQKSIAKKAADMGVDIIFASHPHVLQGMEMITYEDSSRKVPVFYSMGNFISNQRQETLNNRYTEQGIIANIELTYMKSTGQILEISQDVIPTWVDRYYSNGKTVYEVIPLDSDLETNPTILTSGHLARAKQAFIDIEAMYGIDGIRN